MVSENQYDFIIVGSGIAGLYTAIKAYEFNKKVKIITKSTLQECNTKYAQGGIAAAIDPMDSFEKHFQDTMNAGAGLCDPESVRILITNAVDRISDLINYGVPFDTINGVISLGMEGAHSFPRVLHAGGDSTGSLIEKKMSDKIAETDCDISENCFVSEILVENNKAKGVTIYNKNKKEMETIYGANVVLATGGAGELFYYNTTPEVATGDGVSLAYNAGAAISDMEFFQFHPTALKHPKSVPFLISEAVRGEGAILRNTRMEPFMKSYHSMAELAPRDIVSRAIINEMKKTSSDHVYLDLTNIPKQRVISRFPTIYKTCSAIGIDITTDLIPIAPAAHYMIGGIKTNIWGETTIQNLYACGEVASTGVHGANRLASNSLLEGLVFGKRIVERAIIGYKWSNQNYAYDKIVSVTDKNIKLEVENKPSIESLQKLMWENVSIIRNGTGLSDASGKISQWIQMITEESQNYMSSQLYHMLNVAYLISSSALLRTESRGAHYREDYPETSEKWVRHTTIKKN
ncbi:MAG: L-aspartate oxidase [Candidatus Thermoplasmatota archaeon]|nr:L-aspartate oxidase [Candidatus Thermoplasmatota archaeon]MCL5963446.1 L-aspartate oxidase [Candidatus Thermoplasmatota archaeon]